MEEVMSGLRHRGERGASAVEFALVSVVLFPLLFGILEYGMWFNDSLNVRQGVREGARAGVVQNFDDTGCSGSDMAKLACKTKNRISSVTGAAAVRIETPEGWTKQEPLVVCAQVRSKVMGLVPLPNDRIIRSKTEMSIEVDDPTPASVTYTADSSPAGGNWDWC